MSYQNKPKSELAEVIYSLNPDRFLQDYEIADLINTHRENVTCYRHQQVAAGRCMEVRTIGTRFGYRFTGKVNKGKGSIKCVDPRMPAATTTELKEIKKFINPMLDRCYDTMLAVIKLNANGYWTDKQLAEVLRLSPNTASARRIRLVRDFGLNEHMRGMPNSRERVIAPAGIDLSKYEANIGVDINGLPEIKSEVPTLKAEVKQELSMLNNVFK